MQTVRERIINALADRLEAYDWQQWQPEIFTGRNMFDPEADALPVLTIIPSAEEAEQTRYGTDLVTMQIDVSGLVSLPDEKTVSEDCEPVFGEIRKACFDGGTIDLTFGEGADEITNYYKLQYTGGGIIDYPSELGPAIVTIGVTLAITYETNIGDPYNED